MIKRERKKGQVTIFVIVSVLIVLVVIGFFVLKTVSETRVRPEVENYNSFIDGCLKDKAIINVKDFGLKDKSYYDKDEVNLPSIDSIKKDIMNDLLRKMPSCTDDFTKTNPTYSINSNGEGRGYIELLEEEASFKVTYPVTLNKESKSFSVESEHTATIPLRLKPILLTAEKIILDHADHPDALCGSCIAKFAEENDVYVNISHFDEDTLLFLIRDENYKINDEYYDFIFTIDYEILE